MAASTSKNVGLGAFILVGLLLLTGFIYYIGANQNLFGGTTEVSTVFRNISGLQAGANVRFSGINVGTVDGIMITSDTTVKVTMRVQNDVVPYIKKDSHASIGSDGIMGDKVINLSGGSINQQSVQGGDLVASVEPLEMDSIFAQAERMATGLSTITTNMADMTNHIKAGKGTIGMLLYDDNTANNTRQLLKGVNHTVLALNQNLENTKAGTAAFSENMEALQSNFLFRGYFKKKEKEQKKLEKAAKKRQEAKEDSIKAVEKAEKKQARIEAREQRRLERKIARAARRNADQQAAIAK